MEKLGLEVEKNNKLSVQLQEEGNKTNKVGIYMHAYVVSQNRVSVYASCRN